MSRRIRVIMGILILAISIALLYWGFAPARRETRIQTISPAEMQLPTPSSLQLDVDLLVNAPLTHPALAL
jgi:hypothetical protein